MSRAEIARISYLVKNKIEDGIMTGVPVPGFTVIYHSRHYFLRLWLAIVGHEHGWSVRETNNEDNHEYRHVVMTCTCGESIRVFVPPKGVFSGLSQYINTGYASQS